MYNGRPRRSNSHLLLCPTVRLSGDTELISSPSSTWFRSVQRHPLARITGHRLSLYEPPGWSTFRPTGKAPRRQSSVVLVIITLRPLVPGYYRWANFFRRCDRVMENLSFLIQWSTTRLEIRTTILGMGFDSVAPQASVTDAEF